MYKLTVSEPPHASRSDRVRVELLDTLRASRREGTSVPLMTLAVMLLSVLRSEEVDVLVKHLTSHEA